MSTHPKLTAHLFDLLKEYKWNNPNSTEDQLTEIQQKLDTSKGIDGFVIDPEGNYEPYSIRHQFKINFKSFSIRYFLSQSGSYNTEYKKISESALKGGLMPTYTIQSYWDSKDGGLISFCICRTKDLYDFVESNLDLLINRRRKANNEGNEFIFARFNELYNTQRIPEQVSMFDLAPPVESMIPQPLERPIKMFIYEVGEPDLNRLF